MIFIFNITLTLVVKVIFFAFLFLFISSFFIRLGKVGPTIHGGAHFSHGGPRIGNKGLVISGIRQLTQAQSYVHFLCIAPSGSLKSTSIIFPNLAAKNASYVVTDVKGEIYDLFAPSLQKAGYNVLQLDLINLENSLKYNPLANLTDDASEQELATLLYDLNNKNTEGKTEGNIWRSGAIEIAYILIRCIRNLPRQEYRTIPTLMQWLCYMTEGKDIIDELVKKHAPDQDTLDRYFAFKNEEVKILKGKHSTIRSALSTYDNSKMKQLLSGNDINFSDLRKNKTALFIKTPPASTRADKIVTLFYIQLFNYILESKLEPSNHPLHILMDEFGNLSTLPNFTSTLTLARSKRCAIVVILQDLSQLYQKYGKNNSDTILANLASTIALSGIKNDTTLNYIEKLLGETSTRVGNLEHIGTSIIRKSLMSKIEIRTLLKSQALFIHGNQYAKKLTITPFFENKRGMKENGIRSVKKGNQYELESEWEFIPPDTQIKKEIPYLPIEKFLDLEHGLKPEINQEPKTEEYEKRKPVITKEDFILNAYKKQKIEEILGRDI